MAQKLTLLDYKDKPVGSKEPIVCCNPRKKTAVVFRNATDVSMWCARCGRHERLHVASDIKKQICVASCTSVLIPPDTTWSVVSFPADVIKYLASYPVFTRAIHTGLIGYSKLMDRLVYRYPDERVQCVGIAQLRAYKRDIQPKYLTTLITDGFTPKANAFHSRPIYNHLILCEDLLSYYSISSVNSCAQVGCLLGTNLTDEIANLYHKRIREYEPVYTWFDNDEAGDKARKQAERKFNLLGRLVHHIRTAQDPKYYSPESIGNILNAAQEAYMKG